MPSLSFLKRFFEKAKKYLQNFKKEAPLPKKIKEYYYPTEEEMKEMIVSGRIINAIYPLEILTEKSEIAGGAHLKELLNGARLEVVTKNHVYVLEKIQGRSYYISGHPQYCSEPVEVTISGSTFVQWGSSLKIDFIGRGMHLELVHPAHGTISTSEILDVKEIKAAQLPLGS